MVEFFSNTNANLTCIQVDNLGYSTTNWTNKDAHTSYGEDGCGVELSAKVILQGPYDSGSGLMNDGLRSLGVIPTSTPYSDGVTVSQHPYLM